MKVYLDFKRGTCKVTKEESDPRFTNGGWSSAESTLLYHIKKELIEQGYDVIKKRMWKDGHLVSEKQQYVRNKKYTFAIYNGAYAVYDLGEYFNKIEVGETMNIHMETWKDQS